MIFRHIEAVIHADVRRQRNSPLKVVAQRRRSGSLYVHGSRLPAAGFLEQRERERKSEVCARWRFYY